MGLKESIINILIRAHDEASKVIKELQANGEKLSEGFKTVGKTMMAAGIAGGIALGGAVNVAADFERELSSVKAVSSATAEEMEGLRDLAMEMGADTVFSASEAAAAIEEMVKAGISVEDVMKGGLKGALDLAAAGEIGLADAAEVASTAINAFKLSGSDMAHVADVLAGAANASATDVGELKMALSQAALVASQAGQTLDDTTAALAVFASQGLKGSDAGTSLKTMLLRLSPSTKEAADLMKQLGIITEDGANKFFDAEGNMRSMAEVAQVLQDATKGLTAEQRTMALNTIFGTDAIRAANAMVDAGAKGFENMADAMGKVTAAQVAADKTDNLSGSLEQLKGSLETAAISLGSALIPMIESAADAVKGLVDWFNSLSPETQELIAKIAVAATAFLTIGGAVMYLVGTVPKVVEGFKLVQTAMTGMTGPIGIVIGLLAALAGAWIADVGGIRSATTAWFQDWAANNQETITAVKDALATGWEAIKGLFSEAMAVIGPVVKDAFDMIKAAVEFVMPYVAQTIKDTIAIIQAAWAFWQEYIWPVLSVVMEGIGKLIKITFDAIGAVFRFFAALFRGDWEGVWQAVKDFFGAIWQAIVTIFETVLNAIWTVVKAVFGPLVEWLKGLWDSFWGWLKAGWDAIVGFIKGLLEASARAQVAAFTWLRDKIMAVVEPVWNFLKAGWELLSSAVVTVVTFMRDSVVGAWEGLKSAVLTVAKAIWDPLKAGWEGLRDIVVGAADWIRDKVRAAFDSLVGWVQPIIDKLMGWYNKARDIYESISGWVSKAWDKVKEAGEAAVDAALTVTSPDKSQSGARAHGGPIDRTGLYLLHKGEEVYSPLAASLAASGGAAGGPSLNVTMNISGAQDPEAVAAAVERKVEALMRSYGLA